MRYLRNLLITLTIIFLNSICYSQSNEIHIAIPVIKMNYVDSLKYDYKYHTIEYHCDDDIFQKLDSIAYSIYGTENIYIKIVYDRKIDSSGSEFLYIYRVNIRKKNKTMVRFKIKDIHTKKIQ